LELEQPRIANKIIKGLSCKKHQIKLTPIQRMLYYTL